MGMELLEKQETWTIAKLEATSLIYPGLVPALVPSSDLPNPAFQRTLRAPVVTCGEHGEAAGEACSVEFHPEACSPQTQRTTLNPAS
jgi:hypothetical protein